MNSFRAYSGPHLITNIFYENSFRWSKKLKQEKTEGPSGECREIILTTRHQPPAALVAPTGALWEGVLGKNNKIGLETVASDILAMLLFLRVGTHYFD
jgi:hypothetical protein